MPRRNLQFIYIGLTRADIHDLDMLAELDGVSRSHLCAEWLRIYIDVRKGRRIRRHVKSRYSYRVTNSNLQL